MSRPRVTHQQVTADAIALTLREVRPDLDQSRYLYLLLAQRVGRLLNVVDERHCRGDFGIQASEMRILFALRRSPPSYALRPTELFRSLLVTSGAITKQVDRLVALDYVDRQPGPQRSGGFLVHLTSKGLGVADAALESLAESSIVSNATLSVDERAQLTTLLGKVLNDLEERLSRNAI